MNEQFLTDIGTLVPAGASNLTSIATTNSLVMRGIADLFSIMPIIKDRQYSLASVKEKDLQALLKEGKKTDYLTYSQVSVYLGTRVYRIEHDGPVKILPDDAASREKLHQLLLILEMQCIELIDDTEVLQPEDALSYYKRGNAWFDKEEYSKAISDYEEAIDLDPKYAPIIEERYLLAQQLANSIFVFTSITFKELCEDLDVEIANMRE